MTRQSYKTPVLRRGPAANVDHQAEASSSVSPKPLNLEKVEQAKPHIIRTFWGMQFPLMHRKDLSPAFLYMRLNYVDTYYRMGYNFKQALFSFLVLHNQSMNIWTHFTGFLFFLWLGFKWWMATFPSSTWKFWCFGFFLATIQFCMISSFIFHWFSTLSKWWYFHLVWFDMTAIAVILTGASIAGTYSVFHCYPSVRVWYYGAVAVMAPLVIFLGNMPVLAHPSHKIHRTMLYGSMFLIVVAVGVHARVVLGDTFYGQTYLPRANVALMMLLTGSIIYALNIPERWFRGSKVVELWINSHGIWYAILSFLTFRGLTCR